MEFLKLCRGSETYKCLENGTWDNSTHARERFDVEVAQCLMEIEKYIRKKRNSKATIPGVSANQQQKYIHSWLDNQRLLALQ